MSSFVHELNCSIACLGLLQFIACLGLLQFLNENESAIILNVPISNMN